MSMHFSHLVIRAGALGSAATYRVARVGVIDVLVLDKCPVGHSRGEESGEILAELARDGRSKHPSVPSARIAPPLTDPSNVPAFRLEG